MKHLKLNYIKESMDNYKILNWLESTKKSTSKSEYDESNYMDDDRGYFSKILKTMSDNGLETFYVRDMIELGDIKSRGLHFKNVRLNYISKNSYNDRLSFWIKFDIENPNREKIEKLKKLRDSDRFNDDNFESNKEEFQKLLKEIDKLDEYVSDFTFISIKDIKDSVLNEIVENVTNQSNIDKNLKNLSDRNKKNKMFNNSKNWTYSDRVEYWKLTDKLSDLTDGYIPTEEDLKKRSETYNKSEEEYNKEQERMNNILKDL